MTIKAYASAQPRLQFTDSSGNFLSGGQLFVYAAGTITKITTYQDAGEAASNTNPIVLDSVGRTPAGLFVPPGTFYKVTLAPATDTDPPTNPIWTVDNLGTAVNGTPYAADTGSVNAMVATVVGVPTNPTVGASFIINPANAPTGACTVNANTWGAIALRDPDGAAMVQGSFAAGNPFQITYDGTYWRTPFLAYTGIPYAVDSGLTNAMVVTIASLPSATPLTGASLLLKAAFAPTNSTTLTLNSWPAQTLSSATGNAMTTNSYSAGQVMLITFDGTHMRTLF